MSAEDSAEDLSLDSQEDLSFSNPSVPPSSAFHNGSPQLKSLRNLKISEGTTTHSDEEDIEDQLLDISVVSANESNEEWLFSPQKKPPPANPTAAHGENHEAPKEESEEKWIYTPPQQPASFDGVEDWVKPAADPSEVRRNLLASFYGELSSDIALPTRTNQRSPEPAAAATAAAAAAGKDAVGNPSESPDSPLEFVGSAPVQIATVPRTTSEAAPSAPSRQESAVLVSTSEASSRKESWEEVEQPEAGGVDSPHHDQLVTTSFLDKSKEATGILNSLVVLHSTGESSTPVVVSSPPRPVTPPQAEATSTPGETWTAPVTPKTATGEPGSALKSGQPLNTPSRILNELLETLGEKAVMSPSKIPKPKWSQRVERY